MGAFDFIVPSGSNFLPAVSGITNIGSPSLYFANVYANNIFTSSGSASSSIQSIASSGIGISLYNTQIGTKAYLNSISGIGSVTVSPQVNGVVKISGATIPTVLIASGTAPISVSAAGLVSITTASSTVSGSLTSTDWNTFNNKASYSILAATSGLAATANQTLTSSGAGISLFNTKIGTTQYLNSISGLGTITVFAASPSGVVTISGSTFSVPTTYAQYPVIAATSGLAATAIQSAQNSGTGFTIFNSNIGTSLVFNTISGAGSTTVSSSNGLITVTSPAVSGGNFTGPNPTTNNGIVTWSGATGSGFLANTIAISGSNLILPSGDGIINSVSGINALGSPSNPFSGVYTNHSFIPRNEVWAVSGVALGSINTLIPYFAQPPATNIGTAITYVHSTASGDSFVINEPGIYWVGMEFESDSSADFGITLNAPVATAISAVNPTNRLAYSYYNVVGRVNYGVASNMSWLSAGDIIRPQTNGALGGGMQLEWFKIIKVN